MKFFIDTADIAEIRKAKALGILDGVTTNPSLVAKTGRKYVEVLTEIAKEVDGPVSAEVIATECDGIVKEGRELSKIGPNINIKVPLIEEGLKAVKILSDEGLKTNVTLCFNSVQALMAAKAGATFISPFVGRLDDISADGMEVVEEIVAIYDNYGYDTEVIVASIRNPLHIKHAALIGAHIATIPFSVFQGIIKHPLTDNGLAKFLSDYQKIPK
ncbi:MAG TPA: fructose-6-phosphate aldolase [Spirochaetota bacterium]|nr:fructose-6-phosphate aldolase [Spirochaetota bacterium]HOS41077.1 fructose-6-phosphate aldolase [Spirochaetota bacterium]HPI21663.1 fructose-6-phosphate aldolase [Spirochaetota bacterium]HPU87191.1 fructose-6-phosphate aldolase [Spirochaetota bacterium]